MKKSLDLSKSSAVPHEKETNDSNMPYQFSRVKNIAKGEDYLFAVLNFHDCFPSQMI
jgi:hypothetical protein